MSNIKRINNGYGISIKLLTSCDQILFKTTSSGKVYASYQPAVKNISLNDSMNYTFSYNGLGGVSLFNNSSLFDKMQELKRVFSKFLKSNHLLLFMYATNSCLLLRLVHFMMDLKEVKSFKSKKGGTKMV